MADPNLVDFYSRVARFEKARHAGYGFDSHGTLGRSAFTRTSRRRRSLLPMVALVLCAGFLLKGTIYRSVGPVAYNERVERMASGQGFDRLGGWLMQADPVTLYLSEKIEAGVAYLNKAAKQPQ